MWVRMEKENDGTFFFFSFLFSIFFSPKTTKEIVSMTHPTTTTIVSSSSSSSTTTTTSPDFGDLDCVLCHQLVHDPVLFPSCCHVLCKKHFIPSSSSSFFFNSILVSQNRKVHLSICCAFCNNLFWDRVFNDIAI